MRSIRWMSLGLAACLLFVFGPVACSSWMAGHNSPAAAAAPVALSGKASKGIIQKGVVTTYELVRGSWLQRGGTTLTDATGGYSLSLAGYLGGPARLTLTAGATSTMIWDGTTGNGHTFGVAEPLPADFRMSTVLPSLGSSVVSNIPITPYTNMAAAMVETGLAAATPASVQAAIGTVNMMTGFDVSTTAVVDVTSSAAMAAATPAQQQAAAMAAAVTSLAGSGSIATAVSSLASSMAGGQFTSSSAVTPADLVAAWTAVLNNPAITSNLGGTVQTNLQLAGNNVTNQTVNGTYTPTLAAPAHLAYGSSTVVYVQGVAASSDLPTNTGGQAASYSVSPALPDGLALAADTGVISGTPTTATAVASYTVTALNAAGHATATLTITVSAAPAVPVVPGGPSAPAGLSYTVASASYGLNLAIAANSPSSTGGAVASYSVSPSLPAGLGLNTVTGVLSGTPTAVTAQATYTVTAVNAAGHTQAGIVMTVLAVPTVSAFAASTDTVVAGDASILSFTFQGGAGVITQSGYVPSAAIPDSPVLPGPTAVTSGGTLSVHPAISTTYTLTVTNAANVAAHATTIVHVVPAPQIGSFTAAAKRIFSGGHDLLTAVFSHGASASVDHGVNAITSNGSKGTGALIQDTTFTLTVQPTVAGNPVTAQAEVGIFGSLVPAAGLLNDNFQLLVASAADSAHRIYAVDQGASTISLLTPNTYPNPTAWTVSTIAGIKGLTGYADGGLGVSTFNQPSGIAVDASGLVYVADQGNDLIRLLTPNHYPNATAWTSSTLAGTPYANDGSHPLFYGPTGLAVDSTHGNIFLTDANALIWQLTPNQYPNPASWTSSTIDGGGGQGGIAVDGTGVLFVTDNVLGTIRMVTPDTYPNPTTWTVSTIAGLPSGSFTTFTAPYGIAVDATGNVYVADYMDVPDPQGGPATGPGPTVSVLMPAADHANYAVTVIGGIPGVNGNQDGLPGASTFQRPIGVSVAGSGQILVADNSGIRMLSTTTPANPATWSASTPASNSTSEGSADGAPGTAVFNEPAGVAVDAAGKVYVADTYNDTIRMLTPAVSGGLTTYTLSTIAGVAGAFAAADGTLGTSTFGYPYGVAADRAGNVYVADYYFSTISQITPPANNHTANWVSTTIAGNSNATGADDSPSPSTFRYPEDLAVDAAGNIFVADSYNNSIRMITPTTADGVTTWVVSTIAGGGATRGSDDGYYGDSTLNFPTGLAVDGYGNVYVVDDNGALIRMITPPASNGTAQWYLSTIAGVVDTLGDTDSADGPATFDAFHLTVDGAGNIYVADMSNNGIRLLTPSTYPYPFPNPATWTVTTVVSASNSLSGSARFTSPEGLAVDPTSGGLFCVMPDVLMQVW